MMEAGIPVTNPSRTIMNLAEVLEPKQLERVLDEALRRNMTSIRQLRWGIEQLVGPGGVGALAQLLDGRGPHYLPSASEFQGELRELLQRAGLPATEEYEVRTATGALIGRVDFAFATHRVVVEADGRATHSAREDWEHDLERRNLLTSNGWRVLHVTWWALKLRPEEVLAGIRAALGLSPGASRSRTG
jgi:very-short-patch-repair endonuclease